MVSTVPSRSSKRPSSSATTSSSSTRPPAAWLRHSSRPTVASHAAAEAIGAAASTAATSAARADLHQYHIEHLLRIGRLDLELDRAPDELLQVGKAGGLLVQQHVDDHLRRQHHETRGLELARLAQDLAEDLVAHGLRRLL